MWHQLRAFLGPRAPGRGGGGRPSRPVGPRPHNLFEAAAASVAAGAENDPEAAAEAEEWVSPEALAFGVRELACRAVLALARERGRSPRSVARELLGLPSA